MENQQRNSEVHTGSSVSTTSITTRAMLKKVKGLIQVAVLIILLIMFFMNLFKSPGGNNEQAQAQMSQFLYKILDMPQIGALAAPIKQSSYEHVPRNRTAD